MLPSDHKLPDEADEVSVTDPPEQNVTGPLAKMVGVLGAEFTTTAVTAEVLVQP